MPSNHTIPDQDLTHQGLSSAVEEKLVPIIEEVMDGYGLAGLGIGLVKGGKVLYAQGFGKRNLDTGEPVTDRSLFHLASVSKSFVATAIMQLWEGGQLDLDASITTYLPYFQLKSGDFEKITLRQLLSHTSGMPDSDDYGLHQAESDDEEALERFVRSLADREMVAAPGERYAYSNDAFSVLGDVIAKVSGQSFEAYVKRHIFEPLGMKDSTFLLRDVSPDLATTPHFGAPLMTLPNAYPYNRAHAPNSSLHSSPADMCRWMLANLTHGTLDGQRILREDTYETLWHPVAVTGEETWAETSCLGWFRGTYRERSVVHHGGSDPGYFADKVLLPQEQVGVMVMANTYCATAWAITDAALDLMLGLDPTAPRPPITVPVGARLQAAGPEAAIAEYRLLQATAADNYDFDEHHFPHATQSAIWAQRPDVVMPLLDVWVTLFPESAEAHEELGRAYLVSGDLASAASSLNRAVALNPESETMPKLLQQLNIG
ncbi:serine hydrolase [Chloroflexi bacterium TSY]|nr:serine hydrolase [Chloroflexi bacterium TSY]